MQRLPDALQHRRPGLVALGGEQLTGALRQLPDRGPFAFQGPAQHSPVGTSGEKLVLRRPQCVAGGEQLPKRLFCLVSEQVHPMRGDRRFPQRRDGGGLIALAVGAQLTCEPVALGDESVQ